MGTEGFEPPTPCVSCRYSNQLSYAPSAERHATSSGPRLNPRAHPSTVARARSPESVRSVEAGGDLVRHQATGSCEHDAVHLGRMGFQMVGQQLAVPR